MLKIHPLKQNSLKVFFSVMMLLIFSFNHDSFAGWLNPITSKIQSTDSIPVEIGTSSTLIMPTFEDSINDVNVNNLISFSYDHKSLLSISTTQNISVDFKIDCYDKVGVKMNNISTSSKVLTLKVNPVDPDSLFIDHQDIIFNGAYKIILTINSITINGNTNSTNRLPLNFYLSSQINIERYFKFITGNNFQYGLHLQPFNVSCISGSANNEVLISWQSKLGAEQYDLEWTFVNDYDRGATPNLSQFENFNFENNATRVEITNGTSFRLPLLFERGYIIFRVRGVGRNFGQPSQVIYDAWQPIRSNGTINNSTSDLVYYYVDNSIQHQQNLNWMLSTSFAEDAKKREVISYHDGILNNRQSVTRNSSDLRAIIGETISDYVGRPAVKILPVPYDPAPICDLGTPFLNSGNAIKFYPLFNRNLNHEAYSIADFDFDSQPNTCISSAAPMDSTYGAAKYYSTNNPESEKEYSKFIPNSFGFPFSVTEFTSDNSGKIRRSGGLGNKLGLGTGHETKYLYGQPFQAQIDRLFGSEVGNNSFYKKNLVIDPNGQVSVSYLNKEGKIIATSLAGDSPGVGQGTLLQDIISQTNSGVATIADLFSKDSYGKSLVNNISTDSSGIEFTTQFLVTKEGSYGFKYNLSIDKFNLSCSPICFSCVYDLSISLTDECGTEQTPDASGNITAMPIKKMVGHFTKVNPDGVTFLIDCSPSSVFSSGDLTIHYPNLQVGSYTVKKSLKINQDAINFYLDSYIACTCPITEATFITNQQSLINLDDCKLDCQACAAQLGTKDYFISSGNGTEMEYDFLYDQCYKPCKTESLCQSEFELMVADVSLDGQYAKYNPPTSTNLQITVTDPLSILQVGNFLNGILDWTSTVGKPFYRNPKIILHNHSYEAYLLEDGTRKKVNVDLTGSVYTPQVVNKNLVYFDTQSQSYFTWPENLLNLDDFIAEWDPNFAYSLVCYHPEYAYYLACTTQGDIQVNDTYSSDDFDRTLSETNTWNDALSKKLIKFSTVTGKYTSNEFLKYSLSHPYDPFFTNNFFNSTIGTAFQGAFFSLPSLFLNTEMSNYISNFNNTNHSMEEISAMLNRCNSNFNSIPNNYCFSFGNTLSLGSNASVILDKEWNTFKSLYLSEKQKLQFLRMDFFAKLLNNVNSNLPGGFNSCIENKTYNPFHGYNLNFSPFLNYIYNPFVSIKQPCSIYTSFLFTHKERRFIAPGLPANLDLKEIPSTIYATTGQCPLTIQFQSLLNEMACAGSFTSLNSSYLSQYTSYTQDLYKAFSGGSFPSQIAPYTWNNNGHVGTSYNYSIRNATGQSMGEVTLIFPTSTIISEVKKIANVICTGFNSLSGKFSFSAIASLSNEVPSNCYAPYYQTINITGSTSINIRDCKFEPICKPNEFAIEVQNILNVLYADGVIDNTVDFNNSVNQFTYALKNSLKVTAQKLNVLIPNSNLIWTPNSNSQLFPFEGVLSDPSSAYSILIKFTRSDGLNNSAAISTPLNSNTALISYFDFIKPSQNNLFTIIGVNSTNLETTKLYGEVYLINNGDIKPIMMGDCELPKPLECQGDQNKIKDDLQELLSHFLINNPNLFNGADISADPQFTGLLQSYYNTSNVPSNAVLSNGFDENGVPYENVDFQNLGDCVFNIFYKDYQESYASLSSIISISDLTAYGTADVNGFYYDFYFTANFANNVTDTVFGHSCFPIKNCNVCIPIVKRPREYSELDCRNEIIRERNEGILTDLKNTKLYERYLIVVDSLNTLWGSTIDSVFYVPIINYETFAANGYEYTLNSYFNYLSTFNRVMDDPILLNLSTFVLTYGNYRNCSEDYRRFYESASIYNAFVSSETALQLTTIFVPSDSVFFVYHLCDSVGQYTDYLAACLEQRIQATSILPYFNINTIPAIGDTCGYLYGLYTQAYNNWKNHLLQNSTCNISLYPFYSFSVFNDNHLCCSSAGQALIMDYIASFSTSSCPNMLPDLLNCSSSEVISTDDCSRFYNYLVQIIKDYRTSAFAINTNSALHLSGINKYEDFSSLGLCDCIKDYIAYLGPYLITTDFTLPVPLEIAQFSSCYNSTTTNDPCKLKFAEYTSAVYAYNNWAVEHDHYDLKIENVVSSDYFVKNQLCMCLEKYLGLLASIQSGIITNPNEIRYDLFLTNACDTFPCTSVLPPLIPFPPLPASPDPCETQHLNMAIANAQILYQQYIQQLSEDFVTQYKKHCICALENLTCSYNDKEYHFTLYYYDVAGNLVKTIPPDGVELLNMNDTAIANGINRDRTFSRHMIFTNHRLPTIYEYNSLNQLTRQVMPDQETMPIISFNQPQNLSTSIDVNCIQFKGATNGFLSGNDGSNSNRGYLYNSFDGGENWNKINGLAAVDINDVSFLPNNSNIGYAACSNGVWLYTTDKGASWELNNVYSTGYTSNLKKVSAIYNATTSESIVVMGGEMVGVGASRKGLFRSVNGGVFTSVLALEDNDIITTISVVNNEFYLTTSNQKLLNIGTTPYKYNSGSIYYSANGSTWTKINDFTTNANITTIQYLSNDCAVAAGANGTLLQGIRISGTWNWFAITTPTSKTILKSYFKSLFEGVVLIDSIPGKGQIYSTHDRGASWNLLSKPGIYYTSMRVYDEVNNKLIAIGASGIISRVLLNTPPFAMIEVANTQNNDIRSLDGFLSSNNLDPIFIAADLGKIGSILNPPKLYYSSSAIGITTSWKSINLTGFTNPTLPTQPHINQVMVQHIGNFDKYFMVYLKTTDNTLYYVYLNLSGTFPTSLVVTKLGNAQEFTKIFNQKNTSSYAVYGLTINNEIKRFTFNSYIPPSLISGQPLLVTSAIPSTQVVNDIALKIDNSALVAGNNGYLVESPPLVNSTSALFNPLIEHLNVHAIKATSLLNVNQLVLVGDSGVLLSKDIYTNSFKFYNSGSIRNYKAMESTFGSLAYIGSDNGYLDNVKYFNSTDFRLTKIGLISTSSINAILQTNLNELYVADAAGTITYISNLSNPQPVYSNTNSSGSINCFKSVSYNGIDNLNFAFGDHSGIYQYVKSTGARNNEIYLKNIKSISFANQYNGYVLADNGNIRHTVDAGKNWSVVLPELLHLTDLNKICAPDANAAVVIGNAGYVAAVNNNTLTSINSSTTNDLTGIDFLSPAYGIIVGKSGKILEVTKPTSTFICSTLSLSGVSADLNAVHVFNNKGFVTAGTSGSVYYSNFSGATRTISKATISLSPILPSSTVFNDIDFFDDRTGYLVGNSGISFRCDLKQNIEITNDWALSNANWTYLPLNDDWNIFNNTSKASIDIKAVASATRYRSMFGGKNNNSGADKNYSMLINDEIGYFSSRFWYDKVGRLLVSQNSKQFAKTPQAYSYTLYDKLGRIVESGEKADNSGTDPLFSSIFGSDIGGYNNQRCIDQDKYTLWINAGVSGNSNTSRTEIVHTFYDEQQYPSLTIVQDNLRNRVSSSITMQTYSTDFSAYDFATHYSYDIHGNVKTLWQENKHVPSIASNPQELKMMSYKYDLISGKVNEVVYQKGKSDQFYHKYDYDADNRLTDVMTSSNGSAWEKDAHYIYYPHGPLARVELGERNVQGLDYAYTLQGWIKGVNSNLLKPENDMGADGLIPVGETNPNQTFAYDAAGYSLNYYNGDYDPIGYKNGKITRANNFTADIRDLSGATPQPSNLMSSRYDLFNGNIGSMITTLPTGAYTSGGTLHYDNSPQGYAYQYDQLNRITNALAFQNLNSNNYWQNDAGVSEKYRNNFTYDANGNIKTQVRNDAFDAPIDQLTYNYDTYLNGKLKSNKLYSVTDLVGDGAQSDDIDSQLANNYEYDKLGNLIHDTKEEIDNIEWTVTGKISKITRISGSTKPNLEFKYDASGNRIQKIVKPAGSGNDETQWTKTNYVLDASGNTMALYEDKTVSSANQYLLKEKYIYGSSRLGTENSMVDMYAMASSSALNGVAHKMRFKQYELTNHLGNVLATISDQKIPSYSGTTINHYLPDVKSISDYYPFGSPMAGRNYNASSYLHSFNGQEKDDEIKGSGNSVSFEARMYDPRLGRWMSADPLESKYAEVSPFNFALNTPLSAKDPDGKDVIFVNGYRFGGRGDASDREPSFQNKLRDTYWNIKNKGFTKEVERYFNDHASHFVSGDHAYGSTASHRQAEGYLAGIQMVNSGEIKVSAKNNIMTIVMHSQGNAEGVGIAGGIIDEAKRQGIDVKVNLVFLSVHQPDDIKMSDELKKRGIQFTYGNDNMGILQPMAKQKGSEEGIKGVKDANPGNIEWKEDGKEAHAATIDNNAAFNSIKATDQKEKIYVGKPKDK